MLNCPIEDPYTNHKFHTRNLSIWWSRASQHCVSNFFVYCVTTGAPRSILNYRAYLRHIRFSTFRTFRIYSRAQLACGTITVTSTVFRVHAVSTEMQIRPCYLPTKSSPIFKALSTETRLLCSAGQMSISEERVGRFIADVFLQKNSKIHQYYPERCKYLQYLQGDTLGGQIEAAVESNSP